MSLEKFVKVRLTGNLSKSAGDGSKISELSLKAPAKLSNIIEELHNLHQIELRRDSVLILINGVEANALNDLETVVDSDDLVVFIPMFHGGIKLEEEMKE